jgi:hypothetical protein
MCGQGCRSDHFRMNISTDRRKAALRPGRTRGSGGGRFDESSNAAFTVRHNDGDAVEIHSQYGEYVYEHEKMNERAKIARPCLQNA